MIDPERLLTAFNLGGILTLLLGIITLWYVSKSKIIKK